MVIILSHPLHLSLLIIRYLSIFLLICILQFLPESYVLPPPLFFYPLFFFFLLNLQSLLSSNTPKYQRLLAKGHICGRMGSPHSCKSFCIPMGNSVSSQNFWQTHEKKKERFLFRIEVDIGGLTYVVSVQSYT